MTFAEKDSRSETSGTERGTQALLPSGSWWALFLAVAVGLILVFTYPQLEPPLSQEQASLMSPPFSESKDLSQLKALILDSRQGRAERLQVLQKLSQEMSMEEVRHWLRLVSQNQEEPQLAEKAELLLEVSLEL